MALLYSPHIDYLINRIEILGWSVETVSEITNGPKSDFHTLGRIDYQRRVIEVAASSAREALMTIAHEAGHLIHHQRFNRGLDRKADRATREQRAYLYGWAILRKQKAPITKEDWQDLHGEAVSV